MTPDNHGPGMRERANMSDGKSAEIVMAAIDQRHHRQDCRDAEVADDRAAILAALSGELTQRLSKHPVPPRATPLIASVRAGGRCG